MAEQGTTIVVVQRERYTPSVQFVEPILDAAGVEARAILVDGGSPSPIREWLEDLAVRRDLLLLRVEHVLAPSEARAATLPYLTTEFTSFVDNDVVMSKDWLLTLERTAGETGAFAVGPLCLHGFPHGTPEEPRIHMAGGRCRVIDVDGRRRMDAEMTAYNVLASTAWPEARFETELLEYHCVLVRTDFLRSEGAHDVRLRVGHDMYDLCLKIHEAGGRCWLEPAAVMFYERPRGIDDADRDFYTLRWCTPWDDATMDHFTEVWDLDPDDPDRPFTQYWHAHQRRLGYLPATSWRAALDRKLRALADSAHQARAIANDRARRRAAGGSAEQAAPATVVHAPEWAASAETGVTY